MKSKIKYLLIAALVIALAAGWYAYSEYTRKPADLASVNAVARTDAENLVAMYEKNEQTANGLYLGKVIDVTGVIAEMSNQQDTAVNVILGAGNNVHRVNCLMNVNGFNKVKQYQPGNKIIIRGICTGYLLDVELNRCVVVEK